MQNAFLKGTVHIKFNLQLYLHHMGLLLLTEQDVNMNGVQLSRRTVSRSYKL